MKRGTNHFQHQLVFLGPAILFFTIVLLIPFVIGTYYSFTNWNGLSANPEWVGLDNFIRVLTDDVKFRNAFWFTVKYSVTTVLLVNMVGLLLAILLTRAIKGRSFFRTAYFLPNVIGGLLLGYIFKFIFIYGVPTLGNATGIAYLQTPWLGTAGTAFWGVVIMSVWQISGYMMIIYIAGIINIPSELVEAARIDGANGFLIFRRIIFPLILPSVTICLFLTTNYAFKSFDQILSLTGGGPFGTTEVVALDIYNEAFIRNRMGLGSAKAFIFFVIVAAITVTQVWLTKRKEVEA